MLVLIDTENRLLQYVNQVPDIAWDLIEVNNKPLTIIYPNAKNLAENLIAEDDSIGIRITDDKFCKELIKRFKKPIVSTSANISGGQNPQNFKEITTDIKRQVDYVVKWKQKDDKKVKPSSIIKLGIKNEIKIIRK